MGRTIASAFASVIGSKGAILLVNIVLTPLLVRFLGAGNYGVYATLLATFGILQIFMNSGITGGAMKFLPEDRSLSRWRSNVFAYYFRLATAIGAITSLGLVLAAYSGLVDRLFGPEYAPYTYLLAAFAFASQYRTYFTHVLMGLHLERVSEPLKVAYRVAFAIFALGLLSAGFEVGGVLAGHVLASLVASLLALAMIRNHLSVSTIFQALPDEFPSGELLHFNHLSVLYFAFLTSMYHVDVLILGVFSSNDQVGHYKAALVVVGFLWAVPYSLQMVLVQSVSDLWNRDEVDRITKLASRSTRYVLLLTSLLAIGLAALADEFIPLYFGEEFTPALIPLLILLPGTVGFALARPISAISIAKGDLRPLVVAGGITALGNFGLNLVLVPRYGTVGAAVATTLGYGTLPALLTLVAWQLGYRPFAEARIGRIAVTVVVTCPVILLLGTSIPGAAARLALVPPLGFAAFLIVAIATGAVDFEEISTAVEKVKATYNRGSSLLQ